MADKIKSPEEKLALLLAHKFRLVPGNEAAKIATQLLAEMEKINQTEIEKIMADEDDGLMDRMKSLESMLAEIISVLGELVKLQQEPKRKRKVCSK